MSFYENTLIARQDLQKSELDKIKEKYSDIINNNAGKVIKIEEWGLLNLARKIKKYKKLFLIDGAHNPSACRDLVKTINSLFINQKNTPLRKSVKVIKVRGNR